MASQGHGMHLFKGNAQEGSYPSSVGYEIDCNKEEARMAAIEENMKDDDQALVVHTKKGKSKKEPSSPKKFKKGRRNNPNIICFYCQKTRHITKNCSLIQRPKEKK
jgi:hypothetical protein